MGACFGAGASSWVAGVRPTTFPLLFRRPTYSSSKLIEILVAIEQKAPDRVRILVTLEEIEKKKSSKLKIVALTG
jgi:hypothetical protein